MSVHSNIIAKVYGHPVLSSGVVVGSTSDGVELSPGETYRLCATEDCYIAMHSGVIAADSDDIYLPADNPMYVTLNKQEYFLNSVYVTTDGVLNWTLMGVGGL